MVASSRSCFWPLLWHRRPWSAISVALLLILFVAAPVTATRGAVPSMDDCTSKRILSTERRTITTPPSEMPADLEAAYTRCGVIPIEKYYVDDSNDGKGSHYKFSADDIKRMEKETVMMLVTQRFEVKGKYGDVIKAMRDHMPANASVVVFGSVSPWVEAAAVVLGASSVTTVEYNDLTYDHPSMSTVLVSNVEDSLDDYRHRYDMAISVSSFDHDGLGRYGDPLAPDGDMLAMDMVKSVVKEGGKFILTVPIGPDMVVWNLQRRYGRTRLPLLLEGWEEVDRYNWDEGKLDEEASFLQTYEPVFVLQAPIEEEPASDSTEL